LKAVEVLAELRGPSFPIHYKDWFELLQSAGHEVQGQDPLATFLAQVTRSPVVKSAAPNRGVYVLDPEGASERATATLREAELDLARAHAALNRQRGDTEAAETAPAAHERLARAFAEARRAHRSAIRVVAEVARTQAIIARVRRRDSQVA
jgi:hypothetical protein